LFWEFWRTGLDELEVNRAGRTGCEQQEAGGTEGEQRSWKD